MTDLDVFGLGDGPIEDNPLFADPALEPPEGTDSPVEPAATPSEPSEKTVEAVTVPEAQEVVEVLDPALGGPEIPATEEPTTVVTSSEDQPKVWAGKYNSPEELEKGYRERSEMHRRAAERATAFEQQQAQIVDKARQMEESLRRAIPYIQQLQAENQTLRQMPRFDEMGQPVAVPTPQVQPQGVDPRQLEGYINAQTQAQIAQLRQEMEVQALADQEMAERRTSILGFYEKHPEVGQYTPLDSDIKETLQEFSDAWGDYEPDVSNPDVLEIAYEATKDPALRAVLKKNSSYIDDEDGMKLARFEAAILRGEPITQTTSTVPASAVGTRKPVIEKASTTSPSGTSNAPYDPWREAVEEHRKSERSGFGGSVF